MQSMELTGPGIVTAVGAWSVVIAFDTFLLLLVTHFAGFVWKNFERKD